MAAGGRRGGEVARLPVVSPKLTSRGFESSGFYVMASNTPRMQLVARAGPMGALRAGHSHCDLLSLNLSINDQECLTDPGTYRYVCGSGERDDFRGTSAHNTLRIDGRDQAEAGDSFSWVSPPTVRVQHWIEGHTVDVLAAEHSGYRRLASPATHCRWVIHLKDQFWFVRDVVEGEGRQLLETFWHLAPGLVWKEETAGSFLVEGGEDASRSLALFATDSHNGSGNIRRGWYSRAYGAKTEISVLEFSTVTDVPFESATVLFPGRASTAHLAALSSADRKGNCASVVGYRFEESGKVISSFSPRPGNLGRGRAGPATPVFSMAAPIEAMNWSISSSVTVALRKPTVADASTVKKSWPTMNGSAQRMSLTCGARTRKLSTVRE